MVMQRPKCFWCGNDTLFPNNDKHGNCWLDCSNCHGRGPDCQSAHELFFRYNEVVKAFEQKTWENADLEFQRERAERTLEIK